MDCRGVILEVVDCRGSYGDTAEPTFRALWSRITARRPAPLVADPGHTLGERYGAPQLTRPRLGQSGFQVVVTDAYQRRCAITGERTLPTLEAAHILPYAEHGPHDVQNGLLLRSDFHKLFDKGLVTIKSDFTVEVSPSIHQLWFNGKASYRLNGQPMANLPDDPELRPARRFLEWHNNERFQS
jgi:putative restriction endonuclease